MFRAADAQGCAPAGGFGRARPGQPRRQALAFAAGPVAAPTALPLDLDQIAEALPLRLPDLPRHLAARALAVLRAPDFAPDLAENIGSRTWWRGLATMAAFAAAALAFVPDFGAITDAPPAEPLGQAHAAELRSQGIAPLAWGGESGRRMGPRAAMREVPFVAERATIDLESVLAPGDSLERLFRRAGVSEADAGRAAALIDGANKNVAVPPGTRVKLVLGPRPAPGQPRPLAHAQLRVRLDMALAVNRDGSALALRELPVPVTSQPLRIQGVVGESLYRSARAAGAPAPAIQEYLQALDSHLSLEGDILPGDRFDLVYSVKQAATGETEIGDLVYAGLARANKPVAELLRWGSDGGFYSAGSFTSTPIIETEARGGMLMPVAGRVTSLFGPRRHPILGYTRMHAGVDFGAGWGTPIHAAASGTVGYAGYHGGHGNYVRLEHGGGLGTGYGHMSRIAVSPGQTVSAGQVIGYVGSTGLSTGPHLHYEMYRNGRTVNPLGAQMASVSVVTRQVDPAKLGAFRAKLAAMKALPTGPRLAQRPRAPHAAVPGSPRTAPQIAPQIAMR